jgi:hypothetical protein
MGSQLLGHHRFLAFSWSEIEHKNAVADEKDIKEPNKTQNCTLPNCFCFCNVGVQYKSFMFAMLYYSPHKTNKK